MGVEGNETTLWPGLVLSSFPAKREEGVWVRSGVI